MARDFIGECGKAVEADFADIAATLNFSSAAFKVFAKSGNILALVAADREARTTLVEFRNATLTELTLLYRALYVQAWSTFEAFIRNLIVAYLEEFTARKTDYATLEKFGLTARNLEHTGKALRYIRENTPKLTLDFFLLAKNAATSIPGSTKVILNSSAFPLFLNSPSPDGLLDSLDRIGMKFDWDDLGRLDRVQKSLKTRGTRETSKQIESFLKDTVRRRNNIVHRTAVQEGVGETDVSDVIRILSSFAIGLLELAKADCDEKCK
jgi:hypothetical protein